MKDQMSARYAMTDLPAVVTNSIEPLILADVVLPELALFRDFEPSPELARGIGVEAAPFGDFLPEFKGQKQQQSKWCWAAVCATLSAYYCHTGSPDPACEPLTQCQIANMHPTNDDLDCCSAADHDACNRQHFLSIALEDIGHEHKQESGDRLEYFFMREVRAGRPVPVRVKRRLTHDDGSRTIYHFVIVFGWDSGSWRVLVWDPAGRTVNTRVSNWTRKLGAIERIYLKELDA